MNIVNVSEITQLKKFVNYAEEIINHLKGMGLEMFKNEDYAWSCRENRIGYANAYINLYDQTEPNRYVCFSVGIYHHITTERILSGEINNPVE